MFTEDGNGSVSDPLDMLQSVNNAPLRFPGDLDDFNLGFPFNDRGIQRDGGRAGAEGLGLALSLQKNTHEGVVN